MDLCVHVSDNKNDVLQSYETLCTYFVTCTAKGSRRRKAKECKCRAEKCDTRRKRVHACLHCVFLGCFTGRHIHEHAHRMQHPLAIDTSLGFIFCAVCNDYQYDRDFEKVRREQKIVAAKERSHFIYNWELQPGTNILTKDRIIHANHLNFGLRGILNLGNTCYMSCILQSLIHAPVFRDYFLSDKHRSCPLDKSTIPHSQLANSEICFICEICTIVQEFFSGETEPFLPDRFLYLFWKTVTSLQGYAQHDANEFYCRLVEIFHSHCEETSGKHHVNCMIDKIFTGFKESKKTCKTCGDCISDMESFKCLQLIPTHSIETAPRKEEENETSIDDCLKKSLICDEFIRCKKCEVMRNFDTEMNLKKLPLIINFQIMRALHIRKNTTCVTFEEFIDMTPYLPSYKNQDNLNKALCNKYYLNAVVCHKGKGTGGGHYFSYVKQHKKWFLCDDETVSPAKFENIDKNEVYVLFYHKFVLEHEVGNVKEEVL